MLVRLSCTNFDAYHCRTSTASPLLLQSVRIGAGYDTLSVDLTAVPHERHPSSAKCTMPSPHAHRHLRDVTGRAALQAYHLLLEQQVQQLAGTEPCSQSLPGGVDAGAAGSEKGGAVAPASSKPTGGRLRVRVEASGVTSGVVPQPGQVAVSTARVPNLDIRITGQDLHAPLIERLVELPMDIYAGRVSGLASLGSICF